MFSKTNQTPFAYKPGSQWQSFPADGVPGTNTNTLVRFIPSSEYYISTTNVFWKIIANDGIEDGSVSTNRRFDIGGRQWTDNPLTGFSTRIRNDHIYELRQEINYARVSRTLSSNTWTDTTLTPDQTLIRDDHVMELRTALGELATNLYNETSATNWTDHPLVPYVTPVRTNHIMELREALETL